MSCKVLRNDKVVDSVYLHDWMRAVIGASSDNQKLRPQAVKIIKVSWLWALCWTALTKPNNDST